MRGSAIERDVASIGLLYPYGHGFAIIAGKSTLEAYDSRLWRTYNSTLVVFSDSDLQKLRINAALWMSERAASQYSSAKGVVVVRVFLLSTY